MVQEQSMMSDKDSERIQSIINNQSSMTEDEAYKHNSISMTEAKHMNKAVRSVDRVADKFIRRIAEDSGEDASGWRNAILKSAWKISEWEMDNIYYRARRYYKGGLTRYFLTCLRNAREKKECK